MSEFVHRKPEKKPESVSPKGLTMPSAARRLATTSKKDQKNNPEHIMMDLWAEENTRYFHSNFGRVPLDSILHECNEKCGKKLIPFSMTGSSHYYDGNLNERDLQVAAGVVQWLATNCGQAFLHKFFMRLKDAQEPKKKSATKAR